MGMNYREWLASLPASDFIPVSSLPERFKEFAAVVLIQTTGGLSDSVHGPERITNIH